MTESEWLKSHDATAMLEHLWMQEELSNGKLWLFRVACCRRIAELTRIASIHNTIDLAEALAEGVGDEAGLERFREEIPRGGIDAAQAASRQACGQLLYANCDLAGLQWALNCAALAVGNDVGYRAGSLSNWGQPRDEAVQSERDTHVLVMRDIFGNPFQAADIAQDWLHFNKGIVPSIARAVYDERRWEDMPVLADALEDAGCTDADILNHCRGPGPHVRGCWVVDLLLGKE
jgi:hypothetical protein